MPNIQLIQRKRLNSLQSLSSKQYPTKIFSIIREFPIDQVQSCDHNHSDLSCYRKSNQNHFLQFTVLHTLALTPGFYRFYENDLS